jgi:hypothetical protein
MNDKEWVGLILRSPLYWRDVSYFFRKVMFSILRFPFLLLFCRLYIFFITWWILFLWSPLFVCLHPTEYPFTFLDFATYGVQLEAWTVLYQGLIQAKNSGLCITESITHHFVSFGMLAFSYVLYRVCLIINDDYNWNIQCVLILLIFIIWYFLLITRRCW